MPCDRKRKKKSFLNEKGSFSFYIYFFLIVILLLIVFGLTIPITTQFQTKLYESSEKILNKSIATANEIEDYNVRTGMLASLNAAKSSIPEQVDILTTFYQYSWLIVIVIVMVVWFLLARRSVESEVY